MSALDWTLIAAAVVLTPVVILGCRWHERRLRRYHDQRWAEFEPQVREFLDQLAPEDRHG